MDLLTKSIHQHLQEVLDKRSEAALYRSLQVNEGLVDFCSNDYLSFSRLKKEDQKDQTLLLNGATGSRSISGNTALAEKLEKDIATFHRAEAGLIFNSGYDANVGLFSSIAGKGDTLICDELIHASIIDGCRLSYANRLRFAHNDINELKKKLEKATGNIFVAVESVYSMDGDSAPLTEIAQVCENFGANLIVDEAHGTGVFGQNGRGLVNALNLENKVFARVHTFGKALGGHGAIVLGKEVLRNYLINFARSFIFTTALPPSSLLHIQQAYQQLAAPDFDNSHLHHLIQRFKHSFTEHDTIQLIPSNSPVQSVIISGNERARAVAKNLQSKGFDVRAILSPSVPAGKERLRISLHLHNTAEEVDALLLALNTCIHA